MSTVSLRVPEDELKIFKSMLSTITKLCRKLSELLCLNELRKNTTFKFCGL